MGMFLFLFIVFLTIGVGLDEVFPLIVYFLVLEMAGATDLYVEAIIVIVISSIELMRFIRYAMFGNQTFIEFKDVLGKIKNLFTKKKQEDSEYIKFYGKKIRIKNNKQQDKALENEDTKSIKRKRIVMIEAIILIVFLINSFINPPHSIFLNLIYYGYVPRMLYGIFIPLIIINIINEIREHGFDFTLMAASVLILLLDSAVFSTSLMLAAETSYKEFPQAKDFITSQFKYDNDSYDKIRKEKKVTDKYEFLKGVYNDALDELYKVYDINKQEDFDKIKEELDSKISISIYGFEVSDSIWHDDTMILYIVDKKTNEYDYYKFNIRTNSFEKSTEKEWDELEE